MVVDQKTGYLVKETTPQALAAVIKQALRSPDQLKAMGEAARKRVEDNFSWQVHLTKLWQLYQTVNSDLPDIQ